MSSDNSITRPKTTIQLSGMHFYAYHGYYESERMMGNYFVLNVSLQVDTFDSAKAGIDDTINYEGLYQLCHQRMQKTELLLETVVFKLIEDIKSSYPQLIRGHVSLEKIGPQLGGKIEKAIIGMEF